MENLAYLHLAFAHKDDLSNDELFSKAVAPDWKRLSSKAWRYMLPLAVTLSVISVASSVLALERGDQGPSVKNLQIQLQQAGFYKNSITEVYDFPTEEAVRSFQKAAGINVDGIAGGTTVQRLESWIAKNPNQQPNSTTANQPQRNTTAKRQEQNNTARNRSEELRSATANRQEQNTANREQQASTATANREQQQAAENTTATTTKRSNPNILTKGDEGEAVRVLQERLRVAGFYYGNATGIFGPITEAAVKRFQQAYNLQADGVVGQATLKALPPTGVGYGEEASAKPRPQSDKLGVGDRGEAVRILQAHLIQAGYLQGEPTGYYGPNTADAVKRFQTDNYLTPSGVAGPTTRSKLYNQTSSSEKGEFNVLEIQRRLQARGFYKGALDGVMNEDTKRAIRQAQEFYGITLRDISSGS